MTSEYMNEISLNFESYETVTASMRYETFDPAATLKSLKAMNGGDWSKTKGSVVILIYYFVTRGTRADPKKMSAEGLKLFNNAYSALSCASTSPSPNSVTISRLASLFAGQIALLMKKKNIQPRVTHTGLPNWLCFPQAATLLVEGGSYWADFIEWIVKFDVLINTKSGKIDAEKAKSLASIASRNSLINSSARSAILETIKNTPVEDKHADAPSALSSASAAAAAK